MVEHCATPAPNTIIPGKIISAAVGLVHTIHTNLQLQYELSSSNRLRVTIPEVWKN